MKDEVGVAIERLQLFNHIIREWHVANASVLGCADVSADICASDRNCPSSKVYVLPFKRGQFRESKSGANRDEDQSAFHVRGTCVDNFCDFVLLEKTKCWRRGAKLTKPRDRFECVPFNGSREALAKHRETIVDRLVAISALQLLGFVSFDVSRRYLIELLSSKERDETRGQDVFL